MSQVYNIPQGFCFIEVLADFINKNFNSSLLNDVPQIILPTKRGVLGLRQMIISKIDPNAPHIMPSFVALSELGSINPWYLQEIQDLPPALSSLEYVTWIMDFLPSHFSAQKKIRLACYLKELNDQCLITQVPIQALEQLFESERLQECPDHVKEAASHLHILTSLLPQKLKKENRTTSAFLNITASLLVANYINTIKITRPLIIAGTTGTVPSTQALIQSILHQQNGIVVLPGLDPSTLNLKEQERILAMKTHPQHTLHNLCHALNLNFEDIQNLSETTHTQSVLSIERAQLTSRLFSPPPLACTENALTNPPRLISTETLAEEAYVISLIVKKHLWESSEDEISIVTPHQGLMERIITALNQQGIAVNSSAGAPFISTPVGSFFKVLTDFLKCPNRLSFIHLCKHPLTCKKNRSRHLKFIRLFEKHLRSTQLPWNAQFLNNWIPENDSPVKGFEKNLTLQWLQTPIEKEMASNLMTSLQAILEQRSEQNSFKQFIDFLKKSALLLTDETIFEQEDGKSALVFFNNIINTAPLLNSYAFEEGFMQLLELAPPVHSSLALTSRVRLLGALEARLNTASVIICCGLNEGNWPKTPEADPYLSDSFKQILNLPSSKRQQGLAAHDLCTSFYAPHLYITRSRFEAGEMKIPSRLWTRLYKVIGREWQEGETFKKLAKNLKHTLVLPIQKPAPCPPQTLRPTTYFASHIEQLVQNPYGFYVRNILKIAPLLPLEESLSARDKGQLIHEILDKYLKTVPSPTLDTLLSFSMPYFLPKDVEIDEHTLYTPPLSSSHQTGIKQTFWWYRFQKIAEWWHTKLDKEPVNQRETEINGCVELKGNMKLSYTIKSRADRIELLQSSTLNKETSDNTHYPTQANLQKSQYSTLPICTNTTFRIIDYKTGQLPTQKAILEGKSCQLIIESIIAEQNGFSAFINSFDRKNNQDYLCEYWSLTGGNPPAKVLSFTLTEEQINFHQKALLQTLDYYQGNPYLANPHYTADFDFCRYEEWK